MNVLIRTGYATVLPALFETIVIPPQVEAELLHPRAPTEVRAMISQRPPWLEVRAPHLLRAALSPLGAGEQAAISLALELRADYLLIDERAGRRAATVEGVTVIGTLGIVADAAMERLLDFDEAIERLRSISFRLDDRLLQVVRKQVRADLGLPGD